MDLLKLRQFIGFFQSFLDQKNFAPVKLFKNLNQSGVCIKLKFSRKVF